MKIFIVFALIAIVHGCQKSGGKGDAGHKGDGDKKDSYEDKKDSYEDKGDGYGDKDGMDGKDGMDDMGMKDIDWDNEEAVKKMIAGMPPKGMPMKLWMYHKRKIMEWDSDNLMKKKGKTPREVFEKKMYMKKNTILFGLTENPYSFMKRDFNKKAGVSGFIPSLLHKTCNYCGLKCAGVYVKDSKKCFDETDLSSEGLNNKQFHACPGVPHTMQTAAAFNVSIPMLKTSKSQFYIRPTTTDITSMADLNGKKIGVMGKGYMNEDCLRRMMAKALAADVEITAEIIAADTKEEVVKLLTDRNVEVVLGPEISDALPADLKTSLEGLRRMGEPFQCAHGRGLLHRKDVDFSVFTMCYYYAVIKNGLYDEMAEKYGIPEMARVNYKKYMESGGMEM
ncbi:unnamed protein product [Owenia fusiformis]|uniref:Uncharacterized protein n=1 Tax=Owenia fusiformis TaxID=6347 RepID=A0A8J1UKT9_OWEFU|nr:unnamed protein product [Owenia fusiformis]